MTDLEVGATFETVLLGASIDGVLRIWRGDGSAECRELADPYSIHDVLALGLLARTGTYPERFREVGLLDANTGLLALVQRTQIQAGAESADVPAVMLETTQVTQPAVATDTWRSWGEWLSQVVLAAAARGEYVVVESGGWDVIDEPYCLLGVFSGRSSGSTSMVEALPAPSESPWSGPADDRGGATLEAPASRENVLVAGLLAMPAVTMWASTPLDVVLTFGRCPDGPWPTPDGHNARAADEQPARHPATADA